MGMGSTRCASSAGSIWRMRLAGHPIMNFGAYRATEVAMGRGGERHPLEPVAHELQRQHGDILVDLADGQDRAFVDALVDHFPNRVSQSFRDMLFQLTGGYPLFTLEMALLGALGPALIATRGWGADEVDEVFARARQLGEALERPPELFAVLAITAHYYVYRGQHRTVAPPLYGPKPARQWPASPAGFRRAWSSRSCARPEVWSGDG